MDKVLVEAMEKGLVLLISNVFTTELSDNPVLLGILKCRRSLHRSKHMVKMKVNVYKCVNLETIDTLIIIHSRSVVLKWSVILASDLS